MVVDDPLIREIDEALARDKQAALAKKYGPLFGAFIVGLIAVVGGRQYLEAREVRISGENAVAYQRAGELAESDPDAAIAAFETLMAESPYGYRALAALRAAALAATARDFAKARALLLEVAGSNAPQRMKDLARIRLAYLSTGEGPDAVRRLLNGLEVQNTPYGMFAGEAVGLAAYEAGKFEEAYLLFERITLHPEAQPGTRRRAQNLAALAHLGAQGVALEAAAPAGRAASGGDSLLEGDGFSDALQGALDSLARGELDSGPVDSETADSGTAGEDDASGPAGDMKADDTKAGAAPADTENVTDNGATGHTTGD